MGRPASAPANAFIQEGLTTMRWGTDNFLQDAALQNGAAIVLSIDQEDRVYTEAEENNSGFEVCETILVQGQNYDISVRDDITKSWPATGGKFFLQGPDDQTTIEFLVVGRNYKAERKKPGQRVFKAKCYTAFNVV